jgi:hypothetical protein
MARKFSQTRGAISGAAAIQPPLPDITQQRPDDRA